MTLRLVHSASDAAEAEPAQSDAAGSADEETQGFAIIGKSRLPGSRAFVDQILVGPSGVYAIARKRLAGRVRVAGGLITVNGITRESIAEHVRAFTEALHRLVVLEFGDVGIPVVPLVCVDGCEPPRNAAAGGVRLVSNRGLTHLLRKAPQALTRRDVETLTGVLKSRLAPA
jgi:hypothetical protein